MARQRPLADVEPVLVADGCGRPASVEGGGCRSWPPSKLDYDFKAPVDDQALAEGDRLVFELVQTPAFQRLKDIRFLGGIDYSFVPRPNGSPSATRYTRYQHSLGVLRLARRYCEEHRLGRAERQPICAAALLHDVGHPPFSHSMEPVFKEHLGFEHHEATADIVLGRVPLGKEVFGILRSHDVDPDKVVSMISGEDEERFFSGPINFDTIEAICRSYRYLHPRRVSRSPEDIMLAAMKRTDEEHREIVDGFWRRKGEVYGSLIGSRKAVLSDLACQIYLRRHVKRVGVEDYFGTEHGLFEKLPGLRDLLESPLMEREVMGQTKMPTFHGGWTYFIDESADFFQWRDAARYLRSAPVGMS